MGDESGTGSGGRSQMGRGQGQTTTQDRPVTVEDLGEDVVALAVAAEARGRASVLRRVNGVLVRVIVEVV
jgi:hypothetical protein